MKRPSAEYLISEIEFNMSAMNLLREKPTFLEVCEKDLAAKWQRAELRESQMLTTPREDE